jgi:hypothetical protein
LSRDQPAAREIATPKRPKRLDKWAAAPAHDFKVSKPQPNPRGRAAPVGRSARRGRPQERVRTSSASRASASPKTATSDLTVVQCLMVQPLPGQSVETFNTPSGNEGSPGLGRYGEPSCTSIRLLCHGTDPLSRPQHLTIGFRSHSNPLARRGSHRSPLMSEGRKFR